ncbi:MAG: hypothetical protein MZV70_68635 [Desulfobacterales bacterium]|nr:hypothetical protein [Desulfobacterales bacterium]
MLEPFAAAASPVSGNLRHRLVQTSGVPQNQAVDLLLQTMGLTAQRNSGLDLFNAAETGIALNVPVDILFERNGQKYVVSRFSSDPVSYTLMRLLETRGYRVITLENKDNTNTVISKLLGKMGEASAYTQQRLASDSTGRYHVEISGILLENATPNGGALMFTDRRVEPALRAILADHGFIVQER